MIQKGYDIKAIAETLEGEFVNYSSNDPISELTTDSRQSLNKNFLFFAIVSKRNDGHKYIQDAYQKGVRNFVISKAIDLGKMKDANFILVEDTLKSLQELAKFHRSKFSIPLIGITGSNGKTTVKEWLYHLLQKDYKIVRSPKSYNSQIGVPLSVWRISEEDELGIFEAGISQKGEMQQLREIIQPQIGILTNIGDAHLENFASKKEIAVEKIKLFEDCEYLIYCADDAEMQEVSKNLKAKHIIAWSFHKNSTKPYISRVEKKSNLSEVQIIHNQNEYIYRIPFTDDASIENSISCFFALACLNALNEQTLKRMENLQAVAMRLEIKEGINSSLLINDSYNSDFHSLKIAMQLLSQYNQYSKKILILSDVVQVSQSKKELYQELAQLVDDGKIDLFVGIGEEIKAYQEFFPVKSLFFPDIRHFMKEFNFREIDHSAVLIKGARKFGMEKISEALQQKSHETILEINLDSVIDNLNYFRSLLKKETKIMAMVKAFSYGSGNSEIAKTLQFHQVDYLGVAYADEGTDLRKAGIHVPIMVMNPEIGSYENMIRNRLEPEIYSFRVLHKFLGALEENQYFASTDDPYPIHIKLDTGMHRLGFANEDISSLIEKLNQSGSVKVVSVFSHLTSSEDETHDDYTKMQIATFERMSEEIIRGIGYQPLLHILNSNGVLRFPEYQYDMVRLGIGLYGVAGDEKLQKKLKYVSRLKTHISQVRKLEAGDTVGYSRKGLKEKAGKIATIPIGYADGLGRSLGNGKWQVQIGNRLFPTIGNICMDMCMIDLMDADVEEGEEVLVFGGKKNVKDLSIAMGKSAYEVLTGISSRVKRIYYFE